MFGIDCTGFCFYYDHQQIFLELQHYISTTWNNENMIVILVTDNKEEIVFFLLLVLSLSCFMKCFEKLLYCVEYSMCPHYFIPEINMFENKIEGHERQVLLERLKVLYSYGWRCILMSSCTIISPRH
jgi:hypothetical protein